MSESSNDIPSILGAVVTVLVAIGAGIKWLFWRSDNSWTNLRKREDAYVKKIEDRLQALEKKSEELWLCFSLVASSLHAKDSGDPALTRVAKILGEAFPLDLGIPDEWHRKLEELDRRKVEHG